MLHIERAGGPKKVTWWTLLGLFLIPVIIAGGLIALARPNDAHVRAAIVNLDEAVTIEGQIVPLGRQLAAAMVEEKDTISWTLADYPSALRGVESGEYAAMIVIPKAFSASATSFSKNKASEARQANIQVTLGKNSPVTDAAIAAQLARIAADKVNTMLTKQYLDNIYIGFNEVGTQFTTIVDGAKQLSDGAKQLDGGLSQASQGATQLSDGMGQFASQMPALVSGIRTLDTEGSNLMDGVVGYTNGVDGVVGGIDQLAKGLRSFESEVLNSKTDYSQLQQLVDGAEQLSDGASGLSGGIDKVSDMLKLLTTAKLPVKGDSTPITCPVDDPETCTIYVQVMTSLRKLADGTISIPPEAFDKIKCPVDDASKCKTFDEVMSLVKAAISGDHTVPQNVIDAFKCPVNDKDTCHLLLRTYLAGFQTGTGVGWAALNVPEPKLGESLRGGAKQLAGGAKQYHQGIKTFVEELPKQAAAQQTKLANGIGEVAAGAEKLAQGGHQLSAGGAKLSSGATQFKHGVHELSVEVGPLVAGSKQLASGASSLADGIVSAKDGSRKLADGLDTFATKLAEGSDQVPSYSANEREILSKVVTRPILNAGALTSPAVATILAVLLAIGLWLGGMACYLVLRAIPSDALTSGAGTWLLAGRALAPGLALAGAQAVLLGIISGTVLLLPIGTTAALIALLAVIAATFVVVNHAVVAWAQGAGRMILFTLAVFALGVGLTSGVPGWISALAQLSPVTPALEGVRSLMAGAPVTADVGILLLWLLVGLGASYVAIARKRTLNADQFLAVARA